MLKLFCVSVLLTFCAGLLSHTLILIWLDGYIHYIEPNRTWLLAEVGLFSLYTIIGFGFSIYALLKMAR